MTTEAPLLPRVAEGDSSAVAKCLDRYKNLVWSLVRRNCTDFQTAEDAVQDIFLKIWKNAGRFDAEIASETTFVAMIARRSLIDMSRKRSHTALGATELDQVSNPEMGVANRAELNDEAAKASAMLADFPSEQRDAIRMSVFEGLSHASIADAMKLPLGTVKTYIRRGMIELRNALFTKEEALDPQMVKGEVQ